MCGIFGYIGKKTNATEIVFGGLKTLEYRGYDSWGIAIKDQRSKIKDQRLIVEKETGKLPNALPKSSILNLQSSLAIGHTRWATHGGVTVANAHPHLDCFKQIAVVHNGIIENFQELKKKLAKQGHIFHSQTDTEIVPHLIEEIMNPSSLSERSESKGENQTSLRQAQAKKEFTTAVREAFNQLQGMNAIVAAYAPSNEIIAAKNGSPLAVGIGKDELFIASDASGISEYTKDVIFLADHQMIILGEKLKLLKLPNGKAIKPEITKLTWHFENTEKGNYPHFILKEIHEQPNVIKHIALAYSDEAKKLAKLIKKAFGTFMLGCGTASYAGLAGTYLFSSIARKHINFTIGSEFKYLEDYVQKGTLVIPISQSGETIDVVEPVEKARKKGATIAALVNVPGSTLYRQADHKFLLGAGQEKAVVATKSFMSMFSILFLTAYTIIDKPQDAKKQLLIAAENINMILKDKNKAKIKKLAEEIKKSEHIYLLGRGLAYATALEAALKIKETSYVHAEGFAGGELKHGVIALIEKATPCIIFAPDDDTYEEIISNAQEVKARGGFIIGIGPKNNEVFDRFIQTASCREATLLGQIAVAQLLAYYLALARGIKDPDKPRNLAKSVTVK